MAPLIGGSLSAPDRTDCVVDAQNGKIVIWHVDTGPDHGMSRMAGAWVVGKDDGDKIDLLVAERRALMTEAGQEALAELCIELPGLIDPDSTLDNLQSVLSELQAVYDAHPKRAGLVAPEWPPLPEKTGVHDLSCGQSQKPTQMALGLARWLEQVATAWDRIESVRIARKYMPGGPARRCTPIAIRKIQT